MTTNKENKDASSAIMEAVKSGNMDRLVMRLDNYHNPDNGFGGLKDPSNKLRFNPLGNGSKSFFEQLYRYSWLAAKIVNTLPEDALREWIDFKSQNNDFIATMNDALKKFKVREKLGKTCINGRIYGGGLMVLGIDDGQEMNEPLNEDNIKEIKYITVLDRFQVTIKNVFNDPLAENFGEPAIYSLQPFNTLPGNGIVENVDTSKLEVHASRTVRIDGETLPDFLEAQNNGWGDSILLAIQKDLQHYGTSIQSVAVLLQDFITKVLQVENLAELLQNADSSALDARLKFAISNQSSLGLTLVGKDEEMKKIQTPVTGVEKLVDIMTTNVAASSGYPKTRLFGQQIGKLSGATETTVEYDDVVKGYQVGSLESPIDRILTLFSKDKSLFPVEEESWQWKFNPLRQDSNETMAKVHKDQADADATYIDRGVLTPDEVAENRFGADGYSLDTIVDIDEREEFDLLDKGLTDFTNKEKEEEIKINPSAKENKKDDITIIINEKDPVKEEEKEEVDLHVHELSSGSMSRPLFLESGEHFHEVYRDGRITVRTSEERTVIGGHIHEMPDGTKTGFQVEDRLALTNDKKD